MPRPRVSVIIPVFNRAGMITEAIDSIRTQSLSDLEIIVVDDGSSDGSVAVVEAIDEPRIRLLRHERNRGIPSARNTGLAAARGEFIAWLDSDDLARPRRLERQVAFLDAHPDIAMVGACSATIGAGIKRKFQSAPGRHEIIRPTLLFRAAFKQPSVTGRAAILKSYPYNPDFPVCEDLDMCLRVSAEHRVANLPEVLMERRDHPGQTVKQQAARVRAYKKPLFAAALDRLGIAADDDELDRHILLGRLRQRAVDREFIDWTQGWLTRIVAANHRHRVYDDAGLAFVCALFWVRACNAGVRGSDRSHGWRRLVSSSLGRGLFNREARTAFAANQAARRSL
ncbi:MAG: glycosyltransferase [Sphingomonas bacterium]|nr:glycosyltransferase [Sphingomonas bacterium]